MNIGFIAHNNRKTLIENFCLAYKYILSKHQLYATGITGRRIEEVTNLKVEKITMDEFLLVLKEGME